MAKDAKGHGSDARGSGSAVHAGSYEALEVGRYGPSAHSWSDYGGDKAAAVALANGHPKSEPVSVHPGTPGLQTIGMGGRTGRYDMSGRELRPVEAYAWDSASRQQNRQPASGRQSLHTGPSGSVTRLG